MKIDYSDTKRKEKKAAKISAASFPWYKAAEADGHLGDAYLGIHSMKAAFDAMGEVPNSLSPIYKQVMTAANAVAKARQETNQLREMARRAAQQY